MIWLLLIGAIILLFVGRNFLKSANATTLLEATISSTDALTYKVSFKPLHSDLKPVEYVRLILCFAAKMLHVIDPKDPNQSHIKNSILASIKKLSDTDLSQNIDVMSVCGQEEIINSTIGTALSKDKKIVATLYFLNPMERAINTTLPMSWFEYQFLHSWLALVQESLPKLNGLMANRLQMSLKKMAELYLDQGIDYSSTKSLNEVPTIAFVDAPAR